jgi:tRNA pseudouridine13 synthase
LLILYKEGREPWSPALPSMKLKQLPEDFQVEERTGVQPGAEGRFAFYRMEKRGWSTPDALAAVRRRWKIDLHRLSYGGLKDRHALSVQYFTILHGPQRRLHHQGVTVEYLGRVIAPYTSRDIRANAFELTLRDLDPSTTETVNDALECIRRQGVPNYFDDQRFGSVGPDGEFIGRMLVFGRFEEALKLALAAPYDHDRTPQKKEKAILNRHWGDWKTCKDALPRSHARSLVDYLVSHPTDFRGAVARLRPELRGLYLSAYQSYLWNRILAEWLKAHCPPEQLMPVKLRLGEMPMYRGLEEPVFQELAALSLPLPSARAKLEENDPRRVLIQTVLAAEGLEMSQLKVKGIRELFFSRGERSALCLPGELHYAWDEDERHPGKRKLKLAFELPRGSYATLLVKRIAADPPDAAGGLSGQS